MIKEIIISLLYNKGLYSATNQTEMEKFLSAVFNPKQLQPIAQLFTQCIGEKFESAFRTVEYIAYKQSHGKNLPTRIGYLVKECISTCENLEHWRTDMARLRVEIKDIWYVIGYIIHVWAEYIESKQTPTDVYCAVIALTKLGLSIVTEDNLLITCEDAILLAINYFYIKVNFVDRMSCFQQIRSLFYKRLKDEQQNSKLVEIYHKISFI